MQLKQITRKNFELGKYNVRKYKDSIRGTYHAIRIKHASRYLAEFEYRFNMRFKLEDMIARLAYAYVAVHTPPTRKRYLRLAENPW